MAKALTSQFIKDRENKLKQEKDKTVRQISLLKKGDPFGDPEHASDNAAVDTDVREQVGHDTIEAEIIDLKKRIEDIDIAFQKISKGKYGYCEKCGMQIPIPRLELIPEARFCVECEGKLRK